MTSSPDENADFHTIDESTADDLLAEEPSADWLESFEATLKGLGNVTRLKIIRLLGLRDLCVHDLSALLDMSQSAVSHQLKELRNRDLVTSRKDGRVVYYSLNRQELESTQKRLDDFLNA